MTLPDTYLVYPHRAYGMDQDRYSWAAQASRPKWVLPQGAKLAVMLVVPIEHHSLNPNGKPFKHPGAMVTPYPDLRHYTTRDYGNRVGVYRLMSELRARAIKATFPINAQALLRFKPLVEDIKSGGHEIASYGLSTDHIHWGGLGLDDERAWIDQAVALFAEAGLRPTTWLSPARQQSFATPDLIAKAGFGVCLDWEQDERPLAFRTETGNLISVPLSNEMDDRILMIDRRQSEVEWADQIIDAMSYLRAIEDGNSRVLGLPLTPYVSGQPFRISALRRILDHITQTPEIISLTAAEIGALA
jgi:peptidoglycan/xylan/chitin deacetylase (PgdA/CDA1 family)